MKNFVMFLFVSSLLSGCVVRYTEPGAYYGDGQFMNTPTVLEERCVPVSRMFNGRFYFETACTYVEVPVYSGYIEPGFSVYMGNRNRSRGDGHYGHHGEHHKGGGKYQGDDDRRRRRGR